MPKSIYEINEKKDEPFSEDMGKKFADFLNNLEYAPPNRGKVEEVIESNKMPISIFTAIKWKLFKGKNYAFVLRCSKAGNLKLAFSKNPKEIVWGKKKDSMADKTVITKIYHYLGGHPFYICVEGFPVNVPLNAKIGYSELSPHINATLIHSHQIGVLRGMKMAMKGMFSNPLVMILMLVLVIASVASVYFGMQNLDSSKAIIGLLQRVIDANALIVAQG